MKSTLAAEKTARVRWVFGVSNYVNRTDKEEKFSGNSSIFKRKNRKISNSKRAKYYLYTASRKEEEFYFDAFIAFLANKIKIEKHKSTSQINMWESHLFIADALN